MVTCPLQRHFPLTVSSPPRQTAAGSGLRVMFSEDGEATVGGGAGGPSATAAWAASAGEAAAGGCSGRGGGVVGDSLATHWPFLKSCQGKQPLSEPRLLGCWEDEG